MDAVKCIKSGDNVFVHSVAAVPQALVKAMAERAPELRGVNVYHIHQEGTVPYARPELLDSFRTKSFFVGSNMRAMTQRGEADYIPIFLSEISKLFDEKRIKLNVALISVSSPDRHGFCSLGPAVDVTLSGIRNADVVIAQVNKHIPRVHGAGVIGINSIDYLYYEDIPLPTLKEKDSPAQLKIQQTIASHIQPLVEDGATLQMGIGAIPDAVLAGLKGHKRLGIHSEMFSEGVIELVECGAITGEEKVVFPNKIAASFVLGSQRLYDWMDDNPEIHFEETSFMNNPHIIAKNPKVTAINSALEIDLSGQVCADSLGHRMYSGTGGQIDFIRGASLSKGGKPIIAMPSITSKGESRIVSALKPGAGVVTTRSHIHYVVTEYGAVDLFGKTLWERHKLLIDIAHPDHRARLESELEAFLKEGGRK